jgi:copper type II ascorbate-dependent monooxygenase-like protein
MRARIHFFTAALLCAACGEGESEPGTTSAAVTYYRDVKPILEQHCVQCHSDGNIGEGPLTSYEEASLRAPLIAQQVETRTMPPFHAGPGCNEYEHDPSLADETIATLVQWADLGAPAGDPADDPHVTPGEAPALPRVDLELGMAEPYSPDPSVNDDFRCFVLEWPEATTKYVTGFAVAPGNRSTVHHVIGFYANASLAAGFRAADAADPGPGYACSGGPGGMEGATEGGGSGDGGGTGGTGDGGGGGLVKSLGMISAWVPGAAPTEFAEGVGMAIAPGSVIVLQMHYNTLGWDGEPDQSQVELMLADQVDKEAIATFFTDPKWVTQHTMNIEAGDPDATYTFSFDPTLFYSGGKPFTIYSSGLHMHTRGTSANLRIERGGGAPDECLLDVPSWDFNWQGAYDLVEPVEFSPGDKLRIECHWDNTAANQPIVGGMQLPAQDLNWGEGTTAEMCLAAVFITPE